MRLFKNTIALLAALNVASAQETCQATVTFTQGELPEVSSTEVRQIVTSTAYITTVITSNGLKVARTVEHLVRVLLPQSERLGARQQIITNPVSCPAAVTVTVVTPLLSISTPYTTLTTATPTMTSSLVLQPNINSTLSDLTTSAAAVSNVSTGLSTSRLAETTDFNSSTVAVLSSVLASTFSNSSNLPIMSTPVAPLEPSGTISSASSLANNTSAAIVTARASTSSTPPFPSPASRASTTGSLPSSATTGFSNGVVLDFWQSAAPTVTCEPPCQFSMPCSDLPTPVTISYPDYTTSLCKPNCGSIEFRSTTHIRLDPLTTDRVCFWPMDADATGLVTPIPRWETATRTIDAPKDLNTCPPHHLKPSKDKFCGPDSHYMCDKKECCGKTGKCGKGEDFCGKDCQPNWGACWKNSSSCKTPSFKDSDDKHPIPIFPIWYDMPDPSDFILPPAFPVVSGHVDAFPKCKDLCDDIICKTWGCGDDHCGILGCDGFDLGFFTDRIPKLGCKSLAAKVSCKLFHLGCCKSGSDNDLASICLVPSCYEIGGPPIAVNGVFPKCDDKGCTDSGSNDDNNDDNSDDNKSSSSACSTQTASHVTASCVILTGAGTVTQTSCKTTATTIYGCDITGVTSTFRTSECINTNSRATDVSVSCFATNITTTGGTTIQGSRTCTAITSSVRSGCDLTGTTTSITSFAEATCLYHPSQIDVELATVDMTLFRRMEEAKKRAASTSASEENSNLNPAVTSNTTHDGETPWSFFWL